jgi:hypothetical protein
MLSSDDEHFYSPHETMHTEIGSCATKYGVIYYNAPLHVLVSVIREHAYT